MPNEYRTAFVDNCNYIGILIEHEGKRRAFKIRIKKRIAEKLQDYFHDRGEFQKIKPSLTVDNQRE